MANFIQSRPADKPIVVVMNNAPLHKKAVRERQVDWLLGSVWVWFFASLFTRAEPHEVLWKKIKYEWLRAGKDIAIKN